MHALELRHARRASRPAAAFLVALFLLAVAGTALANKLLPEYRSSSDLLATSPSTDDGAIGALANPAQWGIPEKPEMALLWKDQGVREGALDDWGLVFGK